MQTHKFNTFFLNDKAGHDISMSQPADCVKRYQYTATFTAESATRTT